MDFYSTAPYTTQPNPVYWGTADYPNWPIDPTYVSNVCDSPVSTCSHSTPPPSPARITSRRSRKSKNAPGHVARPPNAFILYRSDFWNREKSKAEPVERNHRDISRIAGICWKELDEEDKQVWKDRAARLSEEHRRQNPNYVFKPAARRPRASKPKSQTLVAKEERCRALASKVIADSVAANQPVENTASPSPPPYTPAEITYHSDFSHIAPNLQVMAPKPMRPVTPETLSPMVGTPPLLFQYDLPAFNNQENPQAVISSPYMDFSAYPPFPAYSTSTSTDVALPETEMWNAYTTFDHQGLATFQSPDVSSPLSYVQSPTSSVSEFSPISTEAPYTQLPGSELAGLEAFIEYCSPPAAFSQLDEDFLLYPY